MTAGHWFNSNNEVTRSEVKMATPSEHRFDGDRRDRWYTSGITHEYVHLPQTRDLRQYSVDAPLWYVEGMAEYFARQYGVPAAGYEPTLETRVDSQIVGGDGYSYMIAREEYDGGVRLIQFLAETYGPVEVATLTRSGSRTLIEALSEDFDLAPLDLESEWLDWAEQNVGGSYETPLLEEFPDNLTGDSTTMQTVTSETEAAPEAGFVGSSDHFTDGHDIEAPAGQSTTDAPVPQQLTPTDSHQFDDVLSIDYFDIHHYDEYENDAQLVAGWLEQLTDGYENFYPHPNITTDVYLYRLDEFGHWTLGASPGDEIVFVTPSERNRHRSEEARDFWIMRTLSRGYIKRLIARELPDSAAAPPFLTGGCGYYIGKEYTTDIMADRFEQRKESFGRDARAGTAYMPQFAIDDWAEDAVWVFEALVDAFGEQFLAKLLNNTDERLSGGFRDGLGIDPYHVEPIFVKWLNTEFNLNYDLSARVTDEDEEDDELDPIVGDSPPQDLNGDGLYRDVDGDGELTVSDVQALFEARDHPTVINNPELFNFSGSSPEEITLEDVRALYKDVI